MLTFILLFKEEGTAKECMTSVVLSQNTREDGTFEDEEIFRSAAATAFLGEFLVSWEGAEVLIPEFLAGFIGGADSVSTCGKFLKLIPC